MRLSQVRITGFRSLSNFEMDTEGISAFLTGFNGAGKTSVLEAIRYALLGRCAWTDARGAGAKALVSKGFQQATIALTLTADAGDVSITAEIPSKKTAAWVAEMNGKVFGERSMLWAHLGVELKDLEAALLPGVHAEGQALGDLLFDDASATLDMDRLKGLCGAHWPWLEAECGTDLKTVSGLKKIGANAKGQRLECGREIKRYEATIQELGEVETPVDKNGKPLTAADRDTLDGLLNQLQVQRDDLNTELGRARVMEANAARTPEQSEEEIQEAEAREAAIAEELKQTSEEISRLQADVKAYGEAEREAERKAERLAIQLENPVKEGDVCPTCGRAYTKAHVSKLRTKAVGMQAEFEDAKKQAENMRGLRETAYKKCQSLIARRADLKARKTTAEDLSMAAHINKGSEAEAPERSSEEIRALLAKNTERTEAASAALKALEQCTRLEKARQQYEAAKERRAHLDWAVKAFDQGKVLNELLLAESEGFLTTVNTVLMPIGYNLVLNVDNGRLTPFLEQNGIVRPLALASNGERKLVEIATGSAFGDKVGMTLIDDLDNLDGCLRDKALKLLSGLKAQAIVAGAWGKPTPGDSSMAAIAEALRIHAQWVGSEEAA